MAAGDLCTVAQIRELRQIPSVDVESDQVIADLITRWSVWIQRKHLRRECAPAVSATARTVQFIPERCGVTIIDLAPWDLRTVTTAVVDSGLSTERTLSSTADYERAWHDRDSDTYLALEVHNVTPLTFPRRRTLTVTGNWGWTSVPSPIAEACIEAVAMTLTDKVEAFGGPLQPNSLGDGVNDAVALPPGIRGLLAPYRR